VRRRFAGVREGARRLMFENSDFQIKTIELQTDGYFAARAGFESRRLLEGENIFKVNSRGCMIPYSSFLKMTKFQVVRNCR